MNETIWLFLGALLVLEWIFRGIGEHHDKDRTLALAAGAELPPQIPQAIVCKSSTTPKEP